MIVMGAIQFDAVIEGGTIRVPEQFRKSANNSMVRVTIRDEALSGSSNAMAWQRFLQGIKACEDHEPVGFECVNFDREVSL
jgi:hypothetical protein